jgi:hypothetical protein
MNHRTWGALDRVAPTRGMWEREQRENASRLSASSQPAPTQQRVADRAAFVPRGAPSAFDPPEPSHPNELTPVSARDILVVGSKLKQYVRDRGGLNTSDSVMDTLSDRLRTLCDRAIRNARRDGRKTVLDRDIS